ncbi:11080_t:CDS:2, partial [Acaulospora colombiana]
KENPSKTELQKLVEELRKIDSKRVDGKFCVGPGASTVPPSQAICSSLVEDCFDIAHEIKARGYSISLPDELKPVYERLKEMRTELERLSLTHRWTLRETDLYNYAVALRDIDQMRKDGKWNVGGLVDGKPSQGQYANKLSTVKKVLNEVLRYGGPFHPRELYPYQLALFQVDSMVKDGKFVGKDGSIPEGQGIVMAHLNECHELIEL